MPDGLSTPSGVVGILLAAGQARRFGSDKLMHPVANGEPMAVVCARRLLQGCGQAVAVLRPEQTALAAWLQREGLHTVLARDAHLGMGHSLAAAVRATPQAQGWVIGLADMPGLQPETIALVAEAIRSGASIAAPLVRGQRAHPVGWAGSWGPALSALSGDQGARALLQAHATQLTTLPCGDAGALIDVDTPADLA